MISVKRFGDRGFILVLTLFLLVIAGTSLAMLARKSHSSVLETLEVEQAMKSKWLERSCERYVLGQARYILETEKQKSGQTRTDDGWNLNDETQSLFFANRSIKIKHNDLNLDICLSNEDAKANVNTLYDQLSGDEVKAIVEKLVNFPDLTVKFSASMLPDSEINLGNGTTSTEDSARDNVVDGPSAIQFYSLDQLFGIMTTQILDSMVKAEQSANQYLTCWSSGMLDYRSADPATIEALLHPKIGHTKVTQLLELRHEAPDLDLSRILPQLDLSEREMAYVNQVISDQPPTSYGMMLRLQSPTRQRYRWSIMTIDQPNGRDQSDLDKIVHIRSFLW
ncbi:hypothetical protein [Poriferisphaera sp. WC338]|uniref:hypothetical protein n=1 Tax=Poriferisphaera sp. WC338 TaxID=3425129 RepID=UPI003D81BC72